MAVGDTVMAAVVAALLHTYVEAAGAVRVVEAPEQMVEVPVIEPDAPALMVTTAADEVIVVALQRFPITTS